MDSFSGLLKRLYAVASNIPLASLLADIPPKRSMNLGSGSQTLKSSREFRKCSMTMLIESVQTSFFVDARVSLPFRFSIEAFHPRDLGLDFMRRIVSVQRVDSNVRVPGWYVDMI